MSKSLKKSKHIHIIKRSWGTHVVYHRLFGNLTVLDDKAAMLLDLFDDPVGGDDLALLFQQYGTYLNTFYDMYYLVEESSDEREEQNLDLEERARSLVDGNLIGGLQLNISDACNFACSYCFCDIVDERGQRRTELADSNEKLMPFEIAAKAIDTLLAKVKNTGKPGLVIKFYGREPLLNWKVIEKILNHYNHGEHHGARIAYAITTNASQLTPEIAQTLAHYKVGTIVSIDGPAASNDRLRRTKNTGSNTFDVIQQGIDCLKKAGALQALSAVVTEENFDEFDNRLVDLAEKHGVKEVQILPGVQGDFLGRMGPEKVIEKLYNIFVYGRRKGIAVSGYWLNPVISSLSTHRFRSTGEVVRTAPDSCAATGYQISVEPSGDIFPCRSMSMHLGHIDDFKKMLKTDAYKHVAMRTYNNVKACHGCSIEGFCQGPCPGNLEEKSNDIYQLDPFFCDVFKGIHEKVLSHFVTLPSYQ
ncbi:MAG: radical SAM protein [Deltaproteobacteria bacterium]|nr:radical SAM protein [Deltaproteobacteria bacterium]